MSKLIFGIDNWKSIYSELPREEKYCIWIYAKLSDNKEVYIKEYDGWFELKKYCATNKINIISIGLKYRSHQIEKECVDTDAVYVVRSVKGEFGGVTKQCYTIGLIKDNTAQKTMWLTPELIEENTYTDNIESCFSEAIIYQNDK
jgi:hypothetical protein